MGGATQVYYNGIGIFNPVTRSWDEETVLDDSGTDAIRKVYRLAFEGILHAVDPGTSRGYMRDASWSDSRTATEVYKTVTAKLWEPRKELSVFFAETELALIVRSSDPVDKGGAQIYDAERDVDNGPKPKHVKLIQITGGNLFRVQFEIEASVTCAASGQVSPILNNRWSISEAMDRNFFTTRTISGLIRLSTSVTPAHQFKGFVVPGLEDGFARESIDYTVSPNGLEATYTIVDRQSHTAAPWPATRMSGTHTESTGDGITFHSHCHVRLEGPPNADKRLLIGRALQIVDSRLEMTARENQTEYYIDQASITDIFGDENAIEVDCRIQQLPEDLAVFLTHLKSDLLGSPVVAGPFPGEPAAHNPRKHEVPALFGYEPHGDTRTPAVLFILHCYLQSPCVNQHAIAQFPQSNEESEAGDSQNEKGTAVSGSVGDVKYNEPTKNYNESASQTIYTVCRLSSKVIVSGGRVQLPLASATDQADPAADTCAVVRVSRGIAKREIYYEMERVGAWPEIPAAPDSYEDPQNLGTITCKLLKHWDEPCAPTIASNGRAYVYRTEGYRLYSMSRPYGPGESPRVGALPIFKATIGDNAMPSGAMSANVGP
jgi:hypothetical protein